MRVRIYEAGQNQFARAVDLGDLSAISLDPRVAQSVFGGPDGDDLSVQAQHRAILDDAEMSQVRSAPRTRFRQCGT
jgi:hypothetical protein